MRPALCHTGRTDQGRGVKWVEMPGELVWSGGSDTGRLSHWILAAAGSASSPLPPASDPQTTARIHTNWEYWVLCSSLVSSVAAWSSHNQIPVQTTFPLSLSHSFISFRWKDGLLPRQQRYLPRVGRPGGRRKRILRLFVNSRYTHVKRDLADSFSVSAAKTVFRSMLIFSIE